MTIIDNQIIVTTLDLEINNLKLTREFLENNKNDIPFQSGIYRIVKGQLILIKS